LRSLGAVPLKRFAYLLPDTPERYEDLQWLAQEIERDGGEATLIRVHQIDNVRPAEVLRLFHEPRDQDYKQLAARHRKVLQALDKAKSDTAQTRIQEDHEAAPTLDLTKLRGRRWVTRRRPHVDRVASAWHRRKEIPMRTRLLVFALLIGSGVGILDSAVPVHAAAPDWKAVEQALGQSGQLQDGDVFRIGIPRTDLSVTVKGVPVNAGFALGSYAAFKELGGHAMVMGDLVLLDQEVPAVMSGLFTGGFEVTALHNHVNEMSPHVMYMH
jgi:hypothetical protein